MAPPIFKCGKTIDLETLKNFERLYIGSAVFAVKKDPNAEVIRFRISGVKDENWEEIARISLYRDGEGYREIPVTPLPTQKQEAAEIISEQESLSDIPEESEESPFI